MAYSEKLKDPRWQKKRLEIMNRAGFACERCGDVESTLHVHHKLYRKGAEPWEYDNHHLACLCEACHEAVHDKDELDELIAMLPYDGPGQREDVAFFVCGILGWKEEDVFTYLGEKTKKRQDLYKSGLRYSDANWYRTVMELEDV